MTKMLSAINLIISLFFFANSQKCRQHLPVVTMVSVTLQMCVFTETLTMSSK